MFGKRHAADAPLGVPLKEMELLLKPTTVKARLRDGELRADHGAFVTRVQVVPPKPGESPGQPIRAVVRLVTEAPDPMAELLTNEGMTGAMNRLASMGALAVAGGTAYVGSRLTIYHAEDVWAKLHLPLLLCAVLGGAPAIFNGLRLALAREKPSGGASLWGAADFAQAKAMLSRVCVCTADDTGLTAEIGLREGEVSAVAGHGGTALLTITADQPHPVLGGGLHCLLQLPHACADEAQLHSVCARLNALEMGARDLPPHFGAWCAGWRGTNPAYVSFFSNPLHLAVPGLALNAAVWATGRARWAHGALARMGLTLG